MDVYIAPSTTPWLVDFEYGETSIYLSLNAGTITLELRVAGSDPAHGTQGSQGG